MWQTHLISTSPDRKSTLKILWSYAPGSIKISLTTPTSERILYSPDGDRIPALHEVAWSSDSHRVAVLVCDLALDKILLGYDLLQAQPLPKGTAAELLEGVIKRRYQLADQDLAEAQGDPITWACSDAGRQRFSDVAKLLPELPVP